MCQDVMSATLFYQLLICASIIAFNLFVLESYNLLSFESLASIYVVATYSILTFIYCYLSDTVTTNLYNIGDTFFGFCWYLLPVPQQKLFILPIQRSQQLYHLNGLGLVDCSLRNFLSVILVYIYKGPFSHLNHPDAVAEGLLLIHILLTATLVCRT